ncbi:MAG: helix-turn-helix domain-containing protein [Gammaproteobacteria bacterium]|nr:helix-turn-helix domain-containing protein [Gammaproteobacteria bacterium]
MPNPLLLFAAQIVAIFSVILLAAGYLKTDPKANSARVFGLIAFFVVLYLLNGMTADHIEPQFQLDLSSWDFFITVGTNTIPGLFMIYCFLIFQEGEKFPLTIGAACGLQILLDAVIEFLSLSDGAATSVGTLNMLSTALDVLMLLFVGFAIYWTLKGWRADLVADRRILRWFIISVQGTLIFAVVFIENFLLAGGSGSNATEQAVIVFSIALLTFGMLLIALRFDFVSLSYVIRKVTELTEDREEEGAVTFDAESFNKVFKDGQLYREAGLTISMLAKKLKMPEYRLRAFIHKQLGFRNFNAMLHQYRIEDAGNALSDGENRNLPVLTIALSVGYQSITPFNNAFREIKGVTPSEYRKKMQQGD